MKARKTSMKNKFKYVLIPMMVFTLASCGNKFGELYAPNQYETSTFMNNYYTERRDFDSIQVSEQNTYNIDVVPNMYRTTYDDNPIEGLRAGDQYDTEGNLLSWNNDYPELNVKDGYGPYNALIHKDPGFSYGYVSKLYDGRIKCDGFTVKSRVQLDKEGYATYFPKALSTYKYFGFAIRGGTDCERSFESTGYPTLDIHISFVKHDTVTGVYSKFNFEIHDQEVMTNNHGNTDYLFFYFDDVLKPVFGDDWNTVLKDTIAMSMSFDLKDAKYDNLVMNRNDADKKHFAAMLYEVLFPNSTWY